MTYTQLLTIQNLYKTLKKNHCVGNILAGDCV
jgi:hypothetical protein